MKYISFLKKKFTASMRKLKLNDYFYILFWSFITSYFEPS